MDARKIYTLVALSAYYNKVKIVLINRVISNAQEPLSSSKEWEHLRKNRNILTWQSVSLPNIHPRKPLEKWLSVQERAAKIQLANMIQLVEAVEATSQPVWSAASLLQHEITTDAKHADIRCMSQKLRKLI